MRQPTVFWLPVGLALMMFGCRGSDLAEALATVKLSDEEARAWNRDIKAARKKLKAPSDKWQ